MSSTTTASPFSYALDLLATQIESSLFTLTDPRADITQLTCERIGSFASAFSVLKTGAGDTNLTAAIAFLGYELASRTTGTAAAEQLRAAIDELKEAESEEED